MRLIMVFIARGWLVLTMTDSPFWVGLAPALRGLTQIGLGAVSGVLLDRFNRRRLLIIAEVGNSLVALAIGFLVITNQITLWHILGASVLEGMFISIRWPAINTILYDVVGSERVLNASAAQMLGFNLGNIIASLAAGLLIEQYGIGSSYLLAAVLGLLSGGAVWMIQGEFRPRVTSESFKTAVGGGIRYIWHSRSLRWLLTLSFTLSFLGWSHISMMPVMARDVLGVDAAGLGFLTTAGGIGAFLATLWIAGLGNYPHKIRLAMFLAAATAVLLILFALSPWYLLSLFLKALLEGCLIGLEATLTAVVLLLTTAEVQGRVQGIYSLIFGFTWLGGVAMGTAATLHSAPFAIAAGGLAVGIVTAVVWRPMRQIKTTP